MEGGGCGADVAVFGGGGVGVEFAGEPELDGCVHAAVEFGEDEESASESLAEGGFGGYGVGEDDPEEGDGAAGGDGGEFVWAEEVDRVVGLAVGGGDFDAEFADLVGLEWVVLRGFGRGSYL